ncbi:hypothetical protein V5O39_29050 [Pseudomonas parakoreensis]
MGNSKSSRYQSFATRRKLLSDDLDWLLYERTKIFINFLSGGSVKSPPATPNSLTKRHLERYVSWLRLKYPNGSTAKNYYTSFKSLVVVLAEYGFIEVNLDDLLPLNPFPNNAQSTKDADPLTLGEMQRLIGALKSDLIAIHKGAFLGNGAEAMAVLLLITAARSGINTTPLLEMKRDALQPNVINFGNYP